MVAQYRDGVIPSAPGDDSIASAAREAVTSALISYDLFDFSRALEQIWTIISAVDKFIVEHAPWKLAKDPSPEAQTKLDNTLYTAAEALRLVCILTGPVLPHSAQAIWEQLGFTNPLSEMHINSLAWGGLIAQKIGKISPVFPRLDPEPTIQRMQELEETEKARQAALMGTKPAETTPAGPAPQPVAEPITIDDFSKVDLRVGEVKSAEPVKGADKLLHLKVDIGEPEPRTIVAGIALAYKPEQLIGRKVVIVANLAPRKLRGLTSQGMIVAASLEGGSPVLAGFHEGVPVGARLK
ncbi:MAG: methionine--tRNA ligase subunit beta [Acidobacteriaceae bacterium]|nr:methionine--tRNA ligase subunit beta [Acidobacteriaceae bacterium]